MPKGEVPMGSVWRGLNKRLSPTLISDQESPDSVNTDWKNGQIGILTGRKGAAKVSDTAYAAPILGLIPAYFPGVSTSERILVVLNNGTIIDDSAFFTGGSGWGGPTSANGFYHEQALSGTKTANSGVVPLDISLNGATRAICTMASIEWATTGSLLIYGTFNNGVGRKLMAEMFAEYVDTCCCGGGGTLTITHTSNLVNISGATKLTYIEAVSDLADGAETISGTVIMMGVPV